MSVRPIFKHNASLHSSLLQKDVTCVSWLVKVLPDFGIAQLVGHRAAKIQAQFEQDVLKHGIDSSVVIWDSTDKFSEYSELLADVLNFASADHVFLQSCLRKWAESGSVLWIFVDAEVIPNEQLLQLLRYRPLSRNGQFAIRILLKISDEQLCNESLALLADAIHEQVGDSVSDTPQPFKAYAGYVFVLILSITSILATLSLSSAKKLPLKTFSSSDNLSQDITSTSGIVENEINKNLVKEISAEQLVLTRILPAVPEVVAASLTEKTEILAFIKHWARAWQEKNSDEFLAMYSNEFSGYRHMSSDEWRSWRKLRLEEPEWVTIEIGPVSIVHDGVEGELRAEFWQLYRSPDYQDDTLKILLLRKEENRWKINSEIKEEVRLLSES